MVSYIVIHIEKQVPSIGSLVAGERIKSNLRTFTDIKVKNRYNTKNRAASLLQTGL